MADPIQFFFDQHMPSAVAKGLRLRGIDVLTAQDAGRCGFADPDQLQFATAEERVLVTYDPDFLALAASGVRHAGIAYFHATKYSVGQQIQMLALIQGVFVWDDMKDRVEYL